MDTFLMYDLYLILLFNIHFMFKQSCSKGCILIIDSIVESAVAPGIHNIWVGTVLQQDGGTFFFLTLHSLLEMHQETDHSFKELRINILQDSLSVFLKRSQSPSHCRHFNQGHLMLRSSAATYLHQTCAFVTVNGVHLTLSFDQGLHYFWVAVSAGNVEGGPVKMEGRLFRKLYSMT